MTKVLITGGAGFIGSHVTDALIESGFSVIIVDNLSTGTRENVNPKARLHITDMRDSELAEIFEQENPDFVIHHAAQASVTKSQIYPVDDSSINILGTVNLLQQCVTHGVKKIIYASSAAVYGDPLYLPVDEDHPVSPMSFYALSKFTPETYIKLFSRFYGIKYCILRYSNVYGPRQNPRGEAGVVSIFIDQLLTGGVPEICGDGEQTRDFVYVRDVAAANLAALHQGNNIVLNISSGKQTTINRLFESTLYACGAEGRAQHGVSRPGDIRHSCLDNTSARATLSWSPSVDLKSGLKQTVEYNQSLK